jgi:hypothetical protein
MNGAGPQSNEAPVSGTDREKPSSGKDVMKGAAIAAALALIVGRFTRRDVPYTRGAEQEPSNTSAIRSMQRPPSNGRQSHKE